MTYRECDRCHARISAGATYTAIRRVSEVLAHQEANFNICVQTELCQDCALALTAFLTGSPIEENVNRLLQTSI